jgi:hypothetical protein
MNVRLAAGTPEMVASKQTFVPCDILPSREDLQLPLEPPPLWIRRWPRELIE